MHCLKCKKFSTDTRRCSHCGASMSAGTAKYTKMGQQDASPEDQSASAAHIPTTPVKWWLTKRSVIGSLLLLAGFIALMLTIDLAPPTSLEEGLARSFSKGNDYFLKSGPYRLAVFLEWSAIIAGLILWALVIKHHYFQELRELSKSTAEKIGIASSTIKDVVKNMAQTPDEDPLETIKKLKVLKDQGVLTEEEFTAKKTELMSKI
jgi:Short C-terminal domain